MAANALFSVHGRASVQHPEGCPARDDIAHSPAALATGAQAGTPTTSPPAGRYLLRVLCFVPFCRQCAQQRKHEFLLGPVRAHWMGALAASLAPVWHAAVDKLLCA